MKGKTPRQWYRFTVHAEADRAELLIYDVIGVDWWTGEGVTARQFVKDLQALPESVATLVVRVNSPGGDVFDAIAIANALKQHRARVEMSIEGLAASAATIITSAGDTIRVADNALMMIHNPWSFAIGEAKEMRQVADELDKIRASIVATYRWVSSKSEDEISALMDAVTWMDADEAIANGFATEKVEGLRAAARLDPRGLAKLPAAPEKFRARLTELVEPPPPAPVAATFAEVLRECDAAGLGTGEVRAYTEAGLSLDEVKAKIQAAKDAKAKAEARATAIRGLCAAASLPDLAEGYIRDGLAVETVKAQLQTITARLAGAEIDTSLAPGQERKNGPTLNPTEIYARFNQPIVAQRNGG